MSDIPEKIGKYRIIKEVGRGATAVVYLAEHPEYPEPVAVKHVRFKDRAKDEAKWNRRVLKLLKAEAAVAKRLDHPNIIRIFEAVVDPDEAYVVMEYFPAESLERYCSFENLLPVHRAIGIVFKCCMALDHAYMKGIVHRDIKPANILVDDEDNVKITDFGLALNINKKVDTDSTFIMGVGSPAYMSPEQIKSYPLNQKTDIYSLGVVLFHLLAGRLPFRASNPAQLVYKIINADPPSISQLVPGLPETMDAVIRKALAKDLYSRYKNGTEFAKDLAAVRYKIVDDKVAPPDTSRFAQLRRLSLLTEFDDIDIWEILRMSTWRKADALAIMVREGDADQRFGILIDGEVELSRKGARIATLKAGDVFGEQAWLDRSSHRQMFTVTAIQPVTWLEVSPAALALATDEMRELCRELLSNVTVQRLAALVEEHVPHADPAIEGNATASMGFLDMQLVQD